MSKLNYNARVTEKRRVRDFLFSLFHYSKIVGLAGPNINEYIEWCISKGFYDITLYENKIKEAIVALTRITPKNLKILTGGFHIMDIGKAPKQPFTVYDMDYCGIITSFKEDVQRMKKCTIMTFSRRDPKGTDKSEDYVARQFFQIRGEKVIKEWRATHFNQKYIYYKTKKGKYIYTNYFDTACMCCIAKIK
jgi:hypothetical protein